MKNVNRDGCKFRAPVPLRLMAGCAVLAITAAAVPDTYTWSGATSTLWSVASNWASNSQPPLDSTSSVIQFEGKKGLTSEVDESWTVGSLNYLSGASPFTLNGNGSDALSLESGIVNNSSIYQVINVNLDLLAAQTFSANSGAVTPEGTVNLGSFDLTVNGGKATNFYGSITGVAGSEISTDAAVGFNNMTGTLGELNVENSGATTTVNNSTLTIGFATNKPSLAVAGALDIINGSTVKTNKSEFMVDTGSITVQGANSLLDFDNTMLLEDGASLSVETGSKLECLNVFNDEVGGGSLVVNNSTANVTQDIDLGTASVASTFSETGPSAIVTCEMFVINSGATASTASVSNGAQLTVSGALEFIHAVSSLNIDDSQANIGQLAEGSAGIGHIDISDGTGGPALTLGSSGISFTYKGSIADGTDGSGSVVKVGAGSATFLGDLTYTGSTFVEDGSFVVSGTGFASQDVEVSSGASLTLNSQKLNLEGGDITVDTGGSATFTGGKISQGTLFGPGTLTIGGNATLQDISLDPSVTLTASGPVNLTSSQNYGTVNVDNGAFLKGFQNESGGTLNVNSAISSRDFVTDGIVNIAPGAQISNIDSSLTQGGGGRMYLGSATSPGGVLDLGGYTLELDGSFLDNNGTIQNGLVDINYGSLAKGTGVYAGGYSVNYGGQIIFGNSPGTLSSGSATWGQGGVFQFQINDATGVAGTNWSLNQITGTLTMAAGSTPASQFTVDLNTLMADDDAGLAANFNPNANYTWTVVETTGGIVGFDPADFVLNSAGFLNTVHGSFSLEVIGNNLDVHYQSVPEPAPLAALGLGVLALLRRRRR